MTVSSPRRTFFAIVVSSVLANSARAFDATCYLPNGTAAFDNTGVMPYTPCNTKTKNSMCCRSNSTDTCRSDGLCNSSWDGNVWRDFCTDPTWQAPDCVKLCLATGGTDGNGNTGGSVRVTQCNNGSYCCGVGNAADSCCNTGSGVWIAKDGHTINVRPGAETSQSSAAAFSSTVIPKKKTSSTSTTSTTAPPTDPAITSAPRATVTQIIMKPSINSGAIAGGVVAGLVAAVLIIGAAVWALRRRRNRPVEEKHTWAPHTVKTPPLYAGEMERSNARRELSADTAAHEMGTGAPPSKQHRMAELP